MNIKRCLGRSWLLLALVLCLVFSFGISALAVQFADIQGHWAAGEIIKAVEKGYIKGYPDGTFKPDRR